MKKEFIYPIKFTPILQHKIWGGNKLKAQFGKVSDVENIGESWELSGVENHTSVVSNGVLQGLSIVDLIKKYTVDLVGEKTYKQFGASFPLLFKFIDAAEDLSIQLHPNDTLAKERHNSFGKTEMWYVLDTDKDAQLYAGFNQQLDKKSYVEAFDKGRILDVLHIDKVRKGDAFFIEVGTVHAIGKGILIAEIQQTSDVTYRIYDWDRTDDNGDSRELHTDLAMEALDFSKVGSCKLNYNNEVNIPNEIYNCKYFTTNKLILDKGLIRDISSIDSFIVYMCIEGNTLITVNNRTEEIRKGETFLIPAAASQVVFSKVNQVSFLEIFIA